MRPRTRASLNLQTGVGRITLDPISIFLSFVAVMIGLYMYTFAPLDFVTATHGLFIVAMILVGIAFGVVLLKSPVEPRLTSAQVMEIMKWFAIGFISIAFLQIVLFKVGQLTTAGVPSKIYYGAMGISEEFAFRFVLLQFLFNYLVMTKNNLFLAAVMTSVIFTMYHSVVYGMLPLSMIIVFVSSMVLSVIAIKSGRLSVPVLVHFLVNFGAG